MSSRINSLADSETAVPHVRRVSTDAPWNWLTRGYGDFLTCWQRSLVYGVAFVVMGLVIANAHAANRTFAMALVAGFLFVSPFLAIGSYELSRQVQRGEPQDLLLSLFCWCRNPRAIGQFALVLAVALMIWLWQSGVVMTNMGMVGLEMPSGQDSDAVEHLPALSLAVWLLVWAVMAVCIFIGSVVSVPMLLDRDVDAITAIRLSVVCSLKNPAALGLWAVIIAIGVGGSLLFGLLPLLITGPLFGHASWHAYLDCIEWQDAG